MSFKTICFGGIVSMLPQARCEAPRAHGAGSLWQR